jgi:hypothetical protein
VKRLLALTAALVIWTLVSFAMVLLRVPHCRYLRPIPPGGFKSPPPPLTQAEIDAITASCTQPSPGTLLVIGSGFGVILAVAWYLRHEDSTRGHELALATSIGVIGGAAATLALAVMLSYATAPPQAPTPAEGYWCFQSRTSPAPHQSRLADEYPCSQEEVNYYIHGTGPSPRSSLAPSLPLGTPVLPGPSQLPGS